VLHALFAVFEYLKHQIYFKNICTKYKNYYILPVFQLVLPFLIPDLFESFHQMTASPFQLSPSPFLCVH